MAAKVNMGNYESLQVTVGITKPCPIGRIDITYAEISEDIKAKMLKEITSMRKHAK